MATRKQKKKTGWDSPATQDYIKSMNWYAENQHNPAFKGKVVAVQAGECVGVGDDHEEVHQQLKARGLDEKESLFLTTFCPPERSSVFRTHHLADGDQSPA